MNTQDLKEMTEKLGDEINRLTIRLERLKIAKDVLQEETENPLPAFAALEKRVTKAKIKSPDPKPFVIPAPSTKLEGIQNTVASLSDPFKASDLSSAATISCQDASNWIQAMRKKGWLEKTEGRQWRRTTSFGQSHPDIS